MCLPASPPRSPPPALRKACLPNIWFWRPCGLEVTQGALHVRSTWCPEQNSYFTKGKAPELARASHVRRCTTGGWSIQGSDATE